MTTRPRCRLAAVLLAATAFVAACGDDDEDVSATPGDQEPAETSTSAAPAAETVTVTAVDYEFQGLPAEIGAGTKINFMNTSTVEAHEFVAVRIPDTETRPVSELVQLPEEEIQALFGSGPPATVLLAGPNRGEVIQAVGDGTISQPGRYAVVCFIPVGADPAVVLDPQAEGPPQGDSPPHAARGMFAELDVK
jgi:plastocyanin